ncbi:hypothetical protein BD779DRAFT_1671428 [Infundibulicybe gibba]|nr:hypothetical protein BD779DRAFT_1671428 [Infundibulicybe gibba]
MNDPISMRSLMDILSKVPSVRNFTIYSSLKEGPVEVIPQDFSALLKNLCSLTCLIPFLAFLAPGRPLVSLHVLDSNSPPLDLGTILGSRGPNTTIRDLEIPSTITPVTASDFPCLRNLKLEFDLDLDYEAEAAKWVTLIVDTCDKWAVSPSESVQWLRMRVSAKFLIENLALQHAMLTGSLLQIFPALRQFQLGHARWERFSKDRAWQVLIPACHRMGIIARFKAGDPCVVDHDGFLQRLSARHDLF